MIVRIEEAGSVLDAVSDPIKQRLVGRATIIAWKKYRAGEFAEGSDLDMKFLTELILELFADPEVIRKELAGERPGAWFDDE